MSFCNLFRIKYHDYIPTFKCITMVFYSEMYFFFVPLGEIYVCILLLWVIIMTCAWDSLLRSCVGQKGRKRRKVRWSNTRTRRKKKGSEDEDENSDEESSEDEESEEEDDSDEDYKVERSRKRRNRNRERRSSDSSTSSDDDLPPNDDPCKHCGLPNHPELVGSHGILQKVYLRYTVS